jgi:predicted regulator of Ras-like GTPase activity (Roadblock/LC7/MglB family)
MREANDEPARHGSHATHRAWWAPLRGRSPEDGITTDLPATPEPAHDRESVDVEESPREEVLQQLRDHLLTPRRQGTPSSPLNTEEKLSQLLADVRRAIPGLTGSMIASEEGLPICYDFPEPDAEMVAAMAAIALGLATQITDRTRTGPLLETVVRGAEGFFVVYAAGPSAVLVLAAPPGANLGVMRIEARALSAHVSAILA